VHGHGSFKIGHSAVLVVTISVNEVTLGHKTKIMNSHRM